MIFLLIKIGKQGVKMGIIFWESYSYGKLILIFCWIIKEPYFYSRKYENKFFKISLDLQNYIQDKKWVSLFDSSKFCLNFF